MSNSAEYADLWLCHEEIRDGEYEYGDEFFVRAATLDEAEKKAQQYLKENYCEEGEEPTIADGWIEETGGYRLMRVSSIREVHSLADILSIIGYAQ